MPGGPGGMEAARIAARRGHEVSLWEKEDRLGGKLTFACCIPGRGELRNLIEYQIQALEKLGVQVYLKKEGNVASRGFQVFFIGDCVQPRKILQAVREGATAGLQI